VAVVGVARKAAHADDEALVQRGGHADLAAEFVADAGFAFRDAVNLGLMQGIDLVRPLGRLVEEVIPGALVTDSCRNAFGLVV
jgi:hypothetical protein